MTSSTHIAQVTRSYSAFFLFCGIGAGALGFLNARVSLSGTNASFRSLGGVDIDAVACRTFEKLTGSPAYAEDLATMSPHRLRELFGQTAPDVLFMSPPCQGLSGLLSEKKSNTPKYRALNELAVVGLDLALGAWGARGPGLIIFENVPRIATRGRALLVRIRKALQKHGYVTHEGIHNCGRIGGLAQSRERFLLVARHSRKVPVFLYQPEQHPLRACGEVLGALPLPGDRSAGRLHSLPKISLRTWLRLAAIRPGHDWRDLASYTASEPALTNGSIRLDDSLSAGPWRDGALGVVSSLMHLGCITGRSSPTNGAFSYADLRVSPRGHSMHWRVLDAGAPTPTVTGATDIQAGAPSLADVRLIVNAQIDSVLAPSLDLGLRVSPNLGCYGVFGLHQPAGTITGNKSPGGSTCNLANPRLAPLPGRSWHHSILRMTAWSSHAGTVTGANRPAAGAVSVSDPRVTNERYEVETCQALASGSATSGVTRRALRATRRVPAGIRTELPAQIWWTSDVRVPSNPRLAVRWHQNDLDASPPYLPVLVGRGDGSWHRPITLLERAALQGLPTKIDGKPLEMEGTASVIAKHIGNAVPVGAAQHIANEMLKTLVLASNGSFMLSSLAGVWVKPRRDGSYPLYLDDELKRARRTTREAVASAFAPCEATT